MTFAFQPLVNTRTGRPVAVEALARPQSGTVYDLLCDAGEAGQLTAADVALASSAVLAAAETHTVGPLHLNVLASTAARAEALVGYLDVALRRAGREPDDITLEISPPFCRVARSELIELHPVTTAGDRTPLIADVLREAVTMAESATADEVRDAFAQRPNINGVVLVDGERRPCGSLDRSRFLLAVTGPYGHALHAKRAAFRHADPPRVIRRDATALQLLEMVGGSDGQRTGDDVVVVDAEGRCAGIVRLTEVVRCVAEAKVEHAAALNPLTRLPGTDTVAREIDRRIARAEMFVVAWLDVDSFKSVNDTVGFAAGDDLIRALGRAMADAESSMPGTRVGHVGGDDFLAVTDLDEIAPLAERLVDPLWTIEGMTVSVSLAALVCGIDSVASYREASKLLAPLKKQAKAVPGSSWVLGRPNSERVEILRGRAGLPRPQPQPDGRRATQLNAV